MHGSTRHTVVLQLRMLSVHCGCFMNRI
uniref:Uncharacterized protein n=1 Tax=Anguilla anguilla TaxID=7936 RepID=A0A0E9ST35_ANGAN